MSSYLVPAKYDDNFLTLLNYTDHNTASLAKTDPITWWKNIFNDGRYLKISGTNVASSAVINSFVSLVTTTLKTKLNIDSFTVSTFSSTMTFDFFVGIMISLEITFVLNSSISITNLPTTALPTVYYTYCEFQILCYSK